VTIRRFEPWGGPGVLPEDGVVVHTDAEARGFVERAKAAGAPIPPLGLLGGDLCRTVGGRGDATRLHDGSGVVLPCDIVAVELDDGPTRWFVAHLAAHRGWWRGQALVAMNAAWLSSPKHGSSTLTSPTLTSWNLGPKAHPNDGLVDVTEARVPIGQRLAVRRRLASGSHLPHPSMKTRRTGTGEWVFDRPTPVHLDGEPVGVARRLRLTVEPDALTIVV
jgi:hypothetical protein